MNNIKSNLIYLRRKNNVTLQQVSDITKSTHRTTVKSWERGDSTPPIDKLISICEYFNVSLDDFVKINLELRK